MIVIDKTKNVPLQVQLISHITSTILNHQLSGGVKMPSTRKLAEYLKISRLTVSNAYNELVDRGYLTSVPQSGFVVSDTVPNSNVETSEPSNIPQSNSFPWTEYLGDSITQKRALPYHDDWRNYKYPFIFGQHDNTLFNHTAWRECVRYASGAKDFNMLASSRSHDDDPLLLEQIQNHILRRRDIHVSQDNILITMGSHHALWLSLHLLSRHCKLAAYEDPGYPDCSEILRFLNIPTTTIPLSNDERQASDIPHHADLIILTTSHQIPTGHSMPLTARKEVLQNACKNNQIIIEDDYDFEMNFSSPLKPTLKSLDYDERVIYLSSFSKSIFPGLRLGYIVASKDVIQQLRRIRSMMMRCVPHYIQRITGYFISQGFYEAHIFRMHHEHKKRDVILREALLQHGLIKEQKQYESSISYWIKGPSGLDSQKLSEALKEKNVLIEDGSPFFQNPQEPCPYFRVGYSVVKPEDIEDGVSIIANQISNMVS